MQTMLQCPAIQGCGSIHFPLDGCSTDEMDILALYSETNNIHHDLFTFQQWQEFIQHLLSFHSNESTPRIMLADVYDRFSASDPLVNVSSWQFLETLREEPYGFLNQQDINKENFYLQELVEKKVAFIRRLFSEMEGVRENVTHVAVLYIDATLLSQEESRSVPHLIKQQETDIKIFAVVVVSEYRHDEAVLLDDTLVGTIFSLPDFGLIMTICDQCVTGWFQFKHTVSTDSVSCYKMLEFNVERSHDSAELYCEYNSSGTLVSMETDEELTFLQAKLASYLKDFGKDSVANNVSTAIHIGLRRAGAGVVKRFQWLVKGGYRFRPLVVNRWLAGKPSGGYTTKCAVWQFSWGRSAILDAANVPGSNEEVVDGWVDVGCDDKIMSFGLFETTLPRRLDELLLIRIKPANDENFMRVLNKQKFVKIGENIFSSPVNIVDSEFRLFLRETNRDFPVFDCGYDGYNPHYISYLHVCDHIDHCDNRNDEHLCAVDQLESQNDKDDGTKKCYGVQCRDGPCLPLHLVNDGEVDCLICDSWTGSFSDEWAGLNKYLKTNETCAFICNNDQCVHFSQLNDGRKDCIGPEGPLDETVGKLKTADTCYNMLGHMIWAPMCVYVNDGLDNLLGCRDLSHLKNCTDFECPEGYVKCPKTYCIPQHYVFDGKLDCPAGEDEHTDIIGPCTGNVACWNSQMCLHPDLVCDGHPNCPHGDDEVDCDEWCAEGFRCVAGTITLADYDRSSPLVSSSVFSRTARYLDLSGMDLENLFEFVISSKSIMFVKCRSCKINNFERIFNEKSEALQDVDVSFNQIHTIDGNLFGSHSFENLRVLNLSYNRELFLVRDLSFARLQTLDLSHTALVSIDEANIGWLMSLKHLDLSFTLVTSFHENAFPSKMVLQTLDLRGLPLESFHDDFFNGLAVSGDLYTGRFELCCPQVRGANIPDHFCHAPDDAISSCFDLIGADVQRALLWVAAVLAVLGNMTVIVYRVIWDKSVLNTGYGLFVSNLGISDFIMGIYLFLIAGADYYYRGIYVLHDKSWRESVTCTIAGFLATFSSETSMLFIFFISLDRFLVMKFPFGQIKFTQKAKGIAVVLSWVFGFFLALTPIVFRFQLYSSNAVCLGLPLTTKRVSGWEFSFGVFIALNLSLCLVIAYGQRAIFRAMSENRIAGTASSTSPRRIEDILVAKQLSLVASSCFLCWFPIGVMGVLSLSGYAISNDLFAWTTVIVLPANPAANPLLYTIPALMAKWEKFKREGKRSS